MIRKPERSGNSFLTCPRGSHATGPSSPDRGLAERDDDAVEHRGLALPFRGELSLERVELSRELALIQERFVRIDGLCGQVAHLLDRRLEVLVRSPT